MNNASQSASTGKDLRIMVVDDDIFQREFIVGLLNDMGISDVISAIGGSDALAKYGQAGKNLDLIICDLHMPDIDGFDLLFHLAQQHFAGAVIIASGQVKAVIDYASLVAQISPFNYLGQLNKPVTKAQLTSLIEKLMLEEGRESLPE